LLAATALGIPSPNERFDSRVARRAAALGGDRQAVPVDLLDTQDGKTHPGYSSNWAGVALAHPAGTFKAVTASFSVPAVGAPAGGTGAHAASAWVGIDGFSCGSAILQAGLDFIDFGDGDSYYGGWYEWFPGPSRDFTDISFKPGDEVTVTVTATSAVTGTAVIHNKSTGEVAAQDVSGPALCGQNAEWIVEDFVSGGFHVPLANFGTVTFTNALATTATGLHLGPTDPSARILDIQLNGSLYTETGIGGSSVTVRY
ncbi:hypothetical protein PHLGIDRAFT_42062, partial [Phlebiopsis gigantea 11061_1 CR5-6]